MIAPLNMAFPTPGVARNAPRYSHLADVLRCEAATEMDAVMGGVPGKHLSSAAVPGCGRHGVWRAINGAESNPLFRLAAMFLVMKRLGMGREGALRLLGWLREVVDAIWPEEEAPAFEEVMQQEAEVDTEEDRYQTATCLGVPGAAERMLDAIRRRHALDPVVMAVLRRKIAAEQT